eukprot:GEMP01071428.1.p1 GENE.GEMP01071428.1~~GEMP01071428.1.p1  ORF type:complete len:131 (+),score=37.32 GEMP01071428.1:101-493(+)
MGHHASRRAIDLDSAEAHRDARMVELRREKNEPYGLQLRWSKNGLEVVSIIPRSPVARFNLGNPQLSFNIGDIVIEVNGYRTQRDMDAALSTNHVNIIVYSPASSSLQADTIGLLSERTGNPRQSEAENV